MTNQEFMDQLKETVLIFVKNTLEQIRKQGLSFSLLIVGIAYFGYQVQIDRNEDMKEIDSIRIELRECMKAREAQSEEIAQLKARVDILSLHIR